MAKSKKRIIEDVTESFGWQAGFHKQKKKMYNGGKWDKEATEKYVTFSGYSNAGEDLEFVEFYDRLDEIPEKLFERYQDFDVDEHVEMWLEGKMYGVKGVPSARVLVEDAEWIEQFILKLAETLLDALS